MEESAESRVGFNKRRAEGKEKGDKGRTLQLKTRKLNPVNTISYVQVWPCFFSLSTKNLGWFFYFVIEFLVVFLNGKLHTLLGMVRWNFDSLLHWSPGIVGAGMNLHLLVIYFVVELLVSFFKLSVRKI